MHRTRYAINHNVLSRFRLGAAVRACLAVVLFLGLAGLVGPAPLSAQEIPFGVQPVGVGLSDLGAVASALVGDLVAGLRTDNDLRVVLVPPDSRVEGLTAAAATALFDALLRALVNGGPETWSIQARSEMDVIVAEQQFQLSTMFDAGARQRAGAAVNATGFAFIEVFPWAEGLMVVPVVVDVRSGTIVATSIGIVGWDALGIAAYGAVDGGAETVGEFVAIVASAIDAKTVPSESRVSAAVRATGDIPWAAVRMLELVAVHRLVRMVDAGSQVVFRDSADALSRAVDSELAAIETLGSDEGLSVAIQDAGIVAIANLVLPESAGGITLDFRWLDAATASYLPGAQVVDLPLGNLPAWAAGSRTVLTIVSDPPNMPAKVDGRPVGATPARVYGLPPGTYTVSVGGVVPYATTVATVDVGEGATAVELAVQRPVVALTVEDEASGRAIRGVAVESPQVTFDGEGSQPAAGFFVSAPIDTHEGTIVSVTIRASGYRTVNRSVELSPGVEPQLDLRVPLQRLTDRRITIAAHPSDALVFVNNRFAGRGTVAGIEISARATEIPVRVQRADFETHEFTIVPAELTEDVVSVSLRRPILFRSTPPGAIIEINGVEVGRTDREIMMPAGNAAVVIRLGSFVHETNINALDLATPEYRVVVRPPSREAALVVQSNAVGLQVWINDQQVDASGGRYLAEEGPALVQFLARGMAPISRRLFLRDEIVLNLFLVPAGVQSQLFEARRQIAEGAADRVVETLEELYREYPSADQVAIVLLEAYVNSLAALVAQRAPSTRIGNLSQRALLVFEERRARSGDGYWVPHYRYLEALYFRQLIDFTPNDDDFYRDAFDRFSEAVAEHIVYTRRYAATDDDLVRYELALYGRAEVAALLATQQDAAGKTDSTTIAVARAAAQDYVFATLPNKDPERVQTVTGWLRGVLR